MGAKVTLFVLCFILWLIFSGRTDAFFLTLGAISSLLAVLITSRMHALKVPNIRISLVAYVFWLAKEVVKSTIDVTLRVWGIRPVSPQFVEVKTIQESDIGYTIYGNSITLTPGTVTVRADTDTATMLVHAISHEGVEAIKSGEMDKRVKKVCG